MNRWRSAVVGVTAVAVLATGCSSDKKTGVASSPSTTASGGTATTSSSGGGGAAGPVIPGKGSGLYGQDASNPKVYNGAGDFKVDTSKCPSDWNPTQGITDKEIRLFSSLPSSGPLAGFGLLADGAKNYFSYVNANGGIGGRNIVFDTKDDAYKPDQTKTNVDEALQSNKYAADFVVLGTPNNLAVWDELNTECMPQLLNGTGAPQWGDVEGHPWTTGMQIDYFTEARLWVEWLKSNKPSAKVASITFNSDFGKSYLKGFQSAIKGTGITLVKDFPHDPTAPNIDNQYTSAAASGADVLLLQTSGAFCTQGMAAVEKGSWKPTVIMSATCASLNQFFQPLIGQNLTGKDTHLIQYIKDPEDPQNANDPFVKTYKEQAQKAGLDPAKTTYFTGWVFAWFMTEILQEAASYKGGLNRGNIIAAARSIKVTNPAFFAGLSTKMEGMKDAYLSEGGQMVVYTVDDPKKLGRFVPNGNLINLEGKLGTYATVKNAPAA